MITGEGKKKKKKSDIRALDREMNELNMSRSQRYRGIYERATHNSACEQFGCSCFILTG